MKRSLAHRAGVAVEALDPRLLFAAGDLDLSFGKGGFVRVQAQPDDSVLMEVAGKSSYVMSVGSVGTDWDLRIDHLSLSRIDSTGKVKSILKDGSAASYFLDSISGFAVQPDGKILVSGFNIISGSNVLRFLPNGELDPTWALGYRSQVPLLGITKPLILPSGKVVIGGSINVGGQRGWNRMALVRLNKDGTFDQSFGQGGLSVLIDEPGYVTHLAAEPGGKLVVGGQWMDDDTDTGYSLLRLNGNGTIDSTWGGRGSASGDSDLIAGLKIMPNGDIYYAIAIWSGFAHVSVYRIGAEGNRATNFDEIIIRFGSLGGDALDVGADGRPVLTGEFDYRTPEGFPSDEYPGFSRIVRWDTDGAFDLAMGGTGFRSVKNLASAKIQPGTNILWTLARDQAGNAIVGRRTGATPPAPGGIRLINGNLSVKGTSGNDTIRVATRGDKIDIVVQGSNVQTFNRSMVKAVFVNGGAGNDRITIRAGSLHVRVTGGTGNDYIDGGTWADGQAGNDTLIMRGSGFARGGLDTDWIDASYSTVDYINAVAGIPVFNGGYYDNGKDVLIRIVINQRAQGTDSDRPT